MGIVDLEEHYRVLLGDPIKGDLEDLERKFVKLATGFRDIKEHDGIHLSAIQQNGEVLNAYLYLKALWEVSPKKREAKEILPPSGIKAFLAHFTLDKIYKELHSLAKAGIIVVAAGSLFQISILLMGVPGSISQSNIQNLNNSIRYDQNIQKMVNAKNNSSYNEDLKLHPYKLDTPLQQPELIMAARNCDTKALESKILSGAPVATTNTFGETALHWTARRNCIEGTKLLLSSNANVNIKDHSGKTPIEWAKLSQNTEVLKLLEKK